MKTYLPQKIMPIKLPLINTFIKHLQLFIQPILEARAEILKSFSFVFWEK